MRPIPKRLWVVVLLLGWGWDLLFWKRSIGLNFLIYTILCLLGGYYTLMSIGKYPAKSIYLLLPVTILAAFGMILRQETFTLFLDLVVTLFGLTLIAISYQGGKWIQYGIVDYISNIFRLGIHMLLNPFVVLFMNKEKTVSENNRKSISPKIVPVIKGVALALPLLVIFSWLFASADLIFNQQITTFLKLFSIEQIPLLILRFGLILSAAYALSGVYLYAAQYSDKEMNTVINKIRLSPFLGMTESGIVLGSVIVLFSFFILLQFKYLFGGQANIHLDGFTYAEYARRGFGELVVVAFGALLLIIGLAAVTERPHEQERRLFNGLISILVGLVLGILASAYQRLTLYEAAYGFSRLRVYTHVFLVWVGVLLMAVLFLELLQHHQRIMFAILVAGFGFVVSINVINVDAFIVRHNLAREQERLNQKINQPVAFDERYLLQLSADAILPLTQSLENGKLEESVNQKVAALLICFENRQSFQRPLAWQEFNLGHYYAEKAIQSVKSLLTNYRTITEEGTVWVMLPSGDRFSCNP
ncbi:MAG: DUF4153 domain-containing protein [Anaerolineales bacterium]